VVQETDLELSDGRILHFYDTGTDDAEARLAVFWHHGTPNTGATCRSSTLPRWPWTGSATTPASPEPRFRPERSAVKIDRSVALLPLAPG